MGSSPQSWGAGRWDVRPPAAGLAPWGSRPVPLETPCFQGQEGCFLVRSALPVPSNSTFWVALLYFVEMLRAREEQPRPRAVVFGSLRAARRRSFGGTAMLENPSGIKAALDLL